MGDKSEQRSTTDGVENPNPTPGSSGLDPQGQFRIGEKISLGARNGKVLLRQAHSGREVEVDEAELQGLLNDTYFVAHGKDEAKG